MMTALIGTKTLIPGIAKYIPSGTSELLCGGWEMLRSVKRYADARGIPLRVFPTESAKFRQLAPLFRNRRMIDCADFVVIFEGGTSAETGHAAWYAEKSGKPFRVFRIPAKTETQSD